MICSCSLAMLELKLHNDKDHVANEMMPLAKCSVAAYVEYDCYYTSINVGKTWGTKSPMQLLESWKNGDFPTAVEHEMLLMDYLWKQHQIDQHKEFGITHKSAHHIHRWRNCMPEESWNRKASLGDNPLMNRTGKNSYLSILSQDAW